MVRVIDFAIVQTDDTTGAISNQSVDRQAQRIRKLSRRVLSRPPKILAYINKR